METDLQGWVAWVFDQPVPEPSLYWNADALGPLKPSTKSLEIVTELFENAAAILRPYSDEQLNQGFWFLCGPESDVMRVLFDVAIPWPVRLRCIDSFTLLFRDLFQSRCTPHLSHLMRAGCPEIKEVGPLNSACYMWWDYDCWCGPRMDGKEHEENTAFLRSMTNTLALPHDACRESALHGLGHWHRAYPTETVQIIDAFLLANGGISEELRRYALAARCGCIQ